MGWLDSLSCCWQSHQAASVTSPEELQKKAQFHFDRGEYSSAWAIYKDPQNCPTCVASQANVAKKFANAEDYERTGQFEIAYDVLSDLQSNEDPRIQSEMKYRQALLASKFKDEIRLATAVEYMKELAGSGHVKAKYQLANWCAIGKGMPKDPVEACRLFESALSSDTLATQPSLFAKERRESCMIIAKNCADTNDGGQLALDVLKPAMDMEPSSEVHYALGKVYLENEQIALATQHFAEATRLAPDGEPFYPALYELGRCFQSDVRKEAELKDQKYTAVSRLNEGNTVTDDPYVMAQGYFNLIPDTSEFYMLAQVRLAEMLLDKNYDGNAVTLVEQIENVTEKEACNIPSHHADALVALSDVYYKQSASKGNNFHNRAEVCLLNASIAGSIEASFKYAEKNYFKSGTQLFGGVKGDYYRAIEHYAIASNGGHAQASHRLYVIYKYGIKDGIDDIVEQNHKSAMDYLRKAMEQGHQLAKSEWESRDKVEHEVKLQPRKRPTAYSTR